MNGAKSAVLMEKVRLGLPGKCHKWGAGPSLWWHTVPCPCRSHWKGVVAKGSPTSQRHLQCRGVSTAKTATNDDLWCRHTTGTGFAQGCVTSEAPAAMELCVLTSGASRQVEWPHSARTAVDPAGIQRYPQGPRYTDPTEWWLVFESVSARRAEGETIAHYGSGSVLQNSDDVGAPASHQQLNTCPTPVLEGWLLIPKRKAEYILNKQYHYFELLSVLIKCNSFYTATFTLFFHLPNKHCYEHCCNRHTTKYPYDDDTDKACVPLHRSVRL